MVVRKVAMSLVHLSGPLVAAMAHVYLRLSRRYVCVYKDVCAYGEGGRSNVIAIVSG